MLLAISKILPRVLHKKARTKVPTTGITTTVSDALTSHTANQLACTVVLLDDSELTINVKPNAKGRMLLEHVFSHLGIVEKDYFGLAFTDDSDQMKWLDDTKTIASQLSGAVPCRLRFGVKFYAADPCKLFEEITRYQFFLQVRRDVTEGRLPVELELAAELAAYVVQSELGDYDQTNHLPGYTSEFEFIPNQTEQFEECVATLHRKLAGQVPARAEYSYLDRVKWLDMFGVVLHPVQGDGGIDYLLGIAPTGIVVYRNKAKVCNHFWPRLVKVSCRSKMFVIRVRDKSNVENTWSFDCKSKQAAKQLCKCCLEHVLFYRRMSASTSYQASNRLFVDGTKNIHGRALSSDVSDPSTPTFVRRPSRRRQRRLSSGSDSFLSAPPQTNLSFVTVTTDINRDETLCDSPTSVHSEFYARRTYCSSECGSSRRHGSRRRHRCCRETTDTDVESSVRSRRRRRAPDADATDSECESVYFQRRRHNDESFVDVRRPQLTDVDDTDLDATRSYFRSRHGSMTSVASAASAPEPRSHRRHHRRRSSSKSPGFRPPRELAQHFRYVDPVEFDIESEQLLTVPYTCVETEEYYVDQSPRTRRRLKQRQQRNYGEFGNERSRGAWLPAGEAPPPYFEPPSAGNPDPFAITSDGSSSSRYQRHYRTHRVAPVDNLQLPMPVHVTQVYTAPIVKIKALCDGSVQRTLRMDEDDCSSYSSLSTAVDADLSAAMVVGPYDRSQQNSRQLPDQNQTSRPPSRSSSRMLPAPPGGERRTTSNSQFQRQYSSSSYDQQTAASEGIYGSHRPRHRQNQQQQLNDENFEPVDVRNQSFYWSSRGNEPSRERSHHGEGRSHHRSGYNSDYDSGMLSHGGGGGTVDL